MREAARALDDVSDHLGEVLRHADELLAEWSRFGAQVRTQVDHEVSAIGEVVDGAVLRAANAGVDRAIVDRLRGLTTEIDRIEQRARAAARAVAEHREADRRMLWAVIAGIVLANALLVAVLLRRPEAAPAAEPIRMEAAPAAPSEPPPAPSQATGAEPPTEPAGSAAGAPDPGAAATAAGQATAPDARDAKPGSAAPAGGAPAGAGGKPAPGAAKPGVDPGGAKPNVSGISLPKPGAARTHKKW
ncbi:MAG TPA: hypothetical protein VH165_26615 [Kofleriaceae bacterium]|jgi:hypothetical protein|nr:hypothetical protein [Kofleriaceae bacterium]